MTFSDILLSEFEKSLVCRDFQSGDTLAWEAVVLPIYEPCVIRVRIIADLIVKFKPFLAGAACLKNLEDRVLAVL